MDYNDKYLLIPEISFLRNYVNGLDMEYSLETVEDKLTHLKIHLWELQQEQKEKRNEAMAYVLDHLTMIADNARMQYKDEPSNEQEE